MATERQSKAARQRKRRRRRRRGGPSWPILLVLGALAVLTVALAAVWQGGAETRAAAGRPVVKGESVPVEVSGRPSLKLDRTLIDFGDVKLDRPVEATFRIANVGDQPLRIASVPIVEVVEGC